MMPARLAIIPQLVGQDRLTNAMALYAPPERDEHVGARCRRRLYVLVGPGGLYFVIATMHIAAVVIT